MQTQTPPKERRAIDASQSLVPGAGVVDREWVAGGGNPREKDP
jgi:hypothetical protein